MKSCIDINEFVRILSSWQISNKNCYNFLLLRKFHSLICFD